MALLYLAFVVAMVTVDSRSVTQTTPTSIPTTTVTTPPANLTVASGCQTRDGHFLLPGQQRTIQGPGLCILYQCSYSGTLQSVLGDCLPPMCVNPVMTENDCCLHCPDGRNCRLPSGEIIPADNEVDYNGAKCKCPDQSHEYPGQQREEHYTAICTPQVTSLPTLCTTEFGELKAGEEKVEGCRVCSCNHLGQSACTLIDCPPIPPCDDAVVPPGECCPRCLNYSACVLPSGAFISAGVTLEANGTECTCPELTVDNDPDLGPRPALCCDKVEGAQEKAKADKLSAKVKKLGAKCTKRKNATKCQERVRNLEAKLAKVNQNNDTQGPTCAERKAAERERDIASLASHLAKCEKKSGKTAEKCLKRAALKAMKIKGMERKGKKQETGQDEVDGASEAGSNDRCAKFKGKRAEKCLERVAAKSGQDKNSGDRDTGKTTGAEKCAKFKGKRAEKCLERVAAKSGQDKNSGDRDTGKTTGAEKCAKFKGKRAEKCLERVAAKSGQDKNSGDRDTGKTTGAEKCAKFKGKRAQRCMERMEAKEDQDLIDRCVNLTGTEAKKCLQRDQKQLEKEMQEKCAKFQGKRAKECMVKMAKKAERMRKKAGRAQKRASSKAA